MVRSLALGLALALPALALGQSRDLAVDTGVEAEEESPFEIVPGPLPPGDMNYIWGGTTAPGFDTVVALGATDGDGYFAPFCSGTVIHSRWVVTAAHCVEAWDLSAQQGGYAGYDPVIYFDDDLRDGYVDDIRHVDNYYEHSGYCGNDCSTIRDDIGLVELASNAPAPTNGVLLDNPQNYVGEYLTFVGFGATESPPPNPDPSYDSGSGTRRKTDMEFQGCVEPNGQYIENCQTNSDAEFLFSTDDNSNVCSGDSGGGVFREVSGEFLLVGVNSYTAGACEDGATGSARVDYYESWIESTAGIQLQSTTTPPDPDTDTDTDPDTDPDTNGDDPFPDTGLGDPERPPDDAYKGGSVIPSCSSVPAGAGLAWPVVLLGLLPLARRRR